MAAAVSAAGEVVVAAAAAPGVVLEFYENCLTWESLGIE